MRIFTLLLGGAIGAGIAMLTSSRTGEENRRMLNDRLNARYGDQIEKGRLRATELIKSSRESLDEYINQGQELVNTAIESARTKAEELQAQLPTTEKTEKTEQAEETTPSTKS